MKKFTQMLFLLLLMGIALPINSAKADSPRMILFEAFTSSNSDNCASYYQSWDKIMLANESFVIPIKFNVPDEKDSLYLANPTVNGNRINYYNLQEYPNYFINGTLIVTDPSNDTLSNIQKLKGLTSPFTINITQVNQATKVTADVKVSASAALNGKSLQVALVEWKVNYKGKNGVATHQWVVRDLVTSPSPLNIAAGANATIPVEFTSISKYKKNNLYIVAFIQDESTKEVLQAGTNLVDRQLQAEVSITTPYYQSVSRNANLSKVFTVKNLSNVETQFQLITDESFISNTAGCQVNWNKTSLTLPAGGSEEVTLTINTTDKAFFADFLLIALPIGTDKIIRYDYQTFDVLTNDAKYAVYTGTHSSNNYAYELFAEKQEYSKDLVAIPATIDQIFTKFPPSQFKLAIMGYDYLNHERFIESSGVQVIEGIKAMLNADKRVLFTSEFMTSLAFNNTVPSSSSFKDFIKRTLQISKSTQKQRFTLDANGMLSLLPFTVHGQNSDIIGQTLGTMNANRTTEYFDLFSDALEINTTNTISAISYYDANPAEIAGIRHEYEKGKIAYYTYGLNSFSNAADRKKLFDNTISWLLSDISDGARIEVDNQSLEFGSVLLNSTVRRNVVIKNKGNKPLVIESISLGTPNSGFIIQNKPSGKTTLNSGQTLELVIAFTPNSIDEYYDDITIESNSKFNSTFQIGLYGEGVSESTFPIISVNSTPIDFDTTELQTTKTHKIVIKNIGVEDLLIDMLDFTVNDGISFSTPEANNTPLLIESDNEEEVNITFTPTTEGTFNGKLRIQSNDPNNPSVIINLTGKGYTKDPGSVIEQGKSKNGNFTMRTLPNPIVNTGSVEFTVATTPANIEMYVIDASGKAIETIYNGASVLGSVNLPINTAKYSNGYYTIIANVNGEQISLPLIISK